MLSGYSTETRAFRSDKHTDGMPVCRDCFRKYVGVVAAERFAMGLSAGLTSEWERVCRFELDEAAVEWGYERPSGCGPDTDGTPCLANAEGFCMSCSTTDCFDCGLRLDTTPDEEQRAKLKIEAAVGVFW